MIKGILLIAMMILMMACNILHQAATYELKTGTYYTKNEQGQKKELYLLQLQDTLRGYQLKKTGSQKTADSIHYISYTFPGISASDRAAQHFVQKGMDLDIFSIVFKLRPATTLLPPQLNTNFNAAGYLGYRWDNYTITYHKTPLNKFEKSSHHFAYGAGIFAGIGATAMNEYVTEPPIDHQYDGVVFAKGITGIIGIGHLSFGLAVGSDNLLGHHHPYWIYQNKLWTGITLGLNLN